MPDEAEHLRRWPGPQDSVSCDKVPSVIEHALGNSWGAQVLPAMNSCAWFKLLRDENIDRGEFDEPDLNDTNQGIFNLQANESAASVTERFLRHVHRHVWQELQHNIPNIETLPVTFNVTVPAAWSTSTRQLTERIAKRAGIAQRPGDLLFTVSEPVAAAIKVFDDNVQQFAVSIDTKRFG